MNHGRCSAASAFFNSLLEARKASQAEYDALNRRH